MIGDSAASRKHCTITLVSRVLYQEEQPTSGAVIDGHHSATNRKTQDTSSRQISLGQ